MYAKCGSIAQARQVFEGIQQPNVVSWNALILGYAENGQGHTALELFTRMTGEGPAPSYVTFVAGIKACTSLAVQRGSDRAVCLARGKTVHDLAVQSSCETNVYVQSSLIDMYSKCGSMSDARQVFDRAKNANIVTWNTLLLGYADNGQGHTALDLFERMRLEGPAPDAVTVMAAVKACTSLAAENECRNRGREIHKIAVENGCYADMFVKSALIDMYSKSGSMSEARQVFDSAEAPDVVSWNALILGYAESGEGHTALYLFARMIAAGASSPSSVTFLAVLKACTSVAGEFKDRVFAIHRLAVQSGYDSDGFVQSSLIDVYAKCGNMVHARQVFESVKLPNVGSWNALILGYADTGQGLTALGLFTRMRSEGPALTSVSFVAALKACSSVAVNAGARAWEECRKAGKEIHELAVESGCMSDMYVQSTLIDMYAKCGSMEDARIVFDSMKNPDVVSWTALILGYAGSGECLDALDLFASMRSQGLSPSSVTVVAALRACSALAVKEGASRAGECRDRGEAIHRLAVQIGLDTDTHVQSALIDMYSKSCSMAEACQVFESMTDADAVCWTALISGYAENGQGTKSLDLFREMRIRGPAPDSVTYAAVLKACALLGALEFGREIHLEIPDAGAGLDVALVTCLVDFYSKCGSLVEAQSVFESHPQTRDTTTWNALLGGFSSCGDTESVLGLFQRMQDAGFRPDAVTFLSLLTCCSHAGLVDKGRQIFDSMSTKYGVSPTLEHYNCMLDIYGRANKLDDAMALLQSMPCSPNGVTWRTILDACRKWKNVEIGRLAFQSLMRSDHREAGGYVLMEQMCGSREDKGEVLDEKLLVSKGLR